MDVEQLNPVDLNLINDLWVPNVFIYNLKTFKVGKGTSHAFPWGIETQTSKAGEGRHKCHQWRVWHT